MFQFIVFTLLFIFISDDSKSGKTIASTPSKNSSKLDKNVFEKGNTENKLIEELAPMPKEVEPDFQFKKLKNGYEFILSRSASEELLDSLNQFTYEEFVGKVIRGVTHESKQKEIVLGGEVFAIAVSKGAPAFKANLAKKIGKKGVVIRVYGIKKGKDRPLLRFGTKLIVPKEYHNHVDAVMTVVRTQAYYWNIEKRD